MKILFGDTRAPQRFWDKIRVCPYTGCWEWTARVSPEGYGQCGYQGQCWQAHRLSFTLLVRDIPEGLVVGHQCDNRPCVNPNHHEIITVQHNTFTGWSPSAMQQRFPVCKLGHPYDAHDKGSRYCLTCRREASKLTMREIRKRAKV